MDRVCLRLNKKTRDDIKEAADALDMTESQVVREAVKEFNEKHLKL